jgi:hypothetical protein
MPRLLYLRLTSESSFSKLTENENLKNHTSLKKNQKEHVTFQDVGHLHCLRTNITKDN